MKSVCWLNTNSFAISLRCLPNNRCRIGCWSISARKDWEKESWQWFTPPWAEMYSLHYQWKPNYYPWVTSVTSKGAMVCKIWHSLLVHRDCGELMGNFFNPQICLWNFQNWQVIRVDQHWMERKEKVRKEEIRGSSEWFSRDFDDQDNKNIHSCKQSIDYLQVDSTYCTSSPPSAIVVSRWWDGENGETSEVWRRGREKIGWRNPLGRNRFRYFEKMGTSRIVFQLKLVVFISLTDNRSQLNTDDVNSSSLGFFWG